MSLREKCWHQCTLQKQSNKLDSTGSNIWCVKVMEVGRVFVGPQCRPTSSPSLCNDVLWTSKGDTEITRRVKEVTSHLLLENHRFKHPSSYICAQLSQSRCFVSRVPQLICVSTNSIEQRPFPKAAIAQIVTKFTALRVNINFITVFIKAFSSVHTHSKKYPNPFPSHPSCTPKPVLRLSKRNFANISHFPHALCA